MPAAARAIFAEQVSTSFMLQSFARSATDGEQPSPIANPITAVALHQVRSRSVHKIEVAGLAVPCTVQMPPIPIVDRTIAD